MLYSKNGSIPQAETDGTEGWIEVADKPECPEGKEVTWLNWEWVIRDPQPADREGYQWNWNHQLMDWVELPYGPVLGGGDIDFIPEVITITNGNMTSNISTNFTF
jgi:hypothetical protein